MHDKIWQFNYYVSYQDSGYSCAGLDGIEMRGQRLRHVGPSHSSLCSKKLSKQLVMLLVLLAQCLDTAFYSHKSYLTNTEMYVQAVELLDIRNIKITQ